MQVPSLAAPIPVPKPPISATAQAAVSPAFVAAQATASSVRTQMSAAPQAAGRSEAPRQTQSQTNAGHTKDAAANVLTATANRAAATRGRGTRLDLSV